MVSNNIVGKRLLKDTGLAKRGRSSGEEEIKNAATCERDYIYYPDAICANNFVNPSHDALYRDSIEN